MSLAGAIRGIRGFRLDRRKTIAIMALACALFVMRRPDAIVRPQFWAEDGAVWYADAYGLGPVRSLFSTQDGYFSTYLRLTADASLALPLRWAPLLFVLVALALQLAPAAVFLSSRFKHVVRSDAARVAIVGLYVLAPNVAETHLNATNAQWYLALLAFLAVTAGPPAGRAWKAFDAGVLALSGLSGPYALFLLPVVALAWLRDRERRHLGNAAILAACAAVQVSALLVGTRGARVAVLPRMDALTLLYMLAKQVWVGGVAGARAGIVAAPDGTRHLFAALAATAAAAIVLGRAVARGPFALKAFILFAGLNLLASLACPNVGIPNSDPSYPGLAWKIMLGSDSGSRYWLFPILAFQSSLAFVAFSGGRVARWIATGFLAAGMVGIVADFSHPPYADRDFPGQAAAFDARPAGAWQTFPLDPDGWEMRLRKK